MTLVVRTDNIHCHIMNVITLSNSQVCMYMKHSLCLTSAILDTIQATSGFYLARLVFLLHLYLSYTTSFILYVISAHTYRTEFVQLLYRILRLRAGNQIQPLRNTITNTIPSINTKALIMITTRL